MKIPSTCFFMFALLYLAAVPAFSQYPDYSAIPAEVNFSKHLQLWDGFGFNYVETSQTTDYEKDPQDYGGFSLLDEKEKKEVIDLVFGEDGLKPGIIKMFLDPWHQEAPGKPFDHATTTANMREFVKMGLQKTRERNDDFTIITTLYGPPAWATQQKIIRGRDLDTKMKKHLATYMIDWVKYLKEEEKLPVKYISLHNEGEDWQRWPRDGKENFAGETGHDYNMYWPPEQIIDFLKFMPQMVQEAGLNDVHVTNGENSNWYRFNHWGESGELYDTDEALNNLGLITSHGFYAGYYGYWYGNHASVGIDDLRKKRPELHAWVTSSSWADMDSKFVRQIFGSIYDVKINGFIPWAGVQCPPRWVGGDPNPGNAIQISEDGTYEVRNGYYFYKQVSRAGQPGMRVARTATRDTEVPIIAFASNNTKNPDAFVVINISSGDKNQKRFSVKGDKKMAIAIKGSKYKKFKAYRTNGKDELYKEIGTFTVKNGIIEYTAGIGTVTTFFGVE